MQKKTKKYTWKCETCEKEYNSCLLDGYYLHDNLIDGVMFNVTKTEDGEVKIEFDPSWSDYLKKLNTEYFLNLAKTNFHKLESVIINCDKCGRCETENKYE
jgi:hypothetical protein